jgi:glycine cleavage system pyridoxal-binding protein P
MLCEGVKEGGKNVKKKMLFDKIKIRKEMDQGEIKKRDSKKKIKMRFYNDEMVGVYIEEKVRIQDVEDLLWVFGSRH